MELPEGKWPMKIVENPFIVDLPIDMYIGWWFGTLILFFHIQYWEIHHPN